MYHVSNTGALSISGGGVSGSIYTNAPGNSISSSITFRDQHDNVGSGSVTINVAK